MSTKTCKTISIMQSNYMPWKGYFDIIAASDEVVLFDEVQYTRADWRNRNKIVSNGNIVWLTVPVLVAGKYLQSINETEIADKRWCSTHWKTVYHSYRRSVYFAEWGPRLESLYNETGALLLLTDVNELLLREVSNWLELPASFFRSELVPKSAASPTDRLIEICAARGADTYISGPAARSYIDPKRFEEAGIRLRYANYEGYPEYRQALPSFDHHVSILDLLFNCGRDSRKHLKALTDLEHFLQVP